MSTYYGRLNGNRGEATRCGTAASGIHATAETWTTTLSAEFAPGGRGVLGVAEKNAYHPFLRLELDADRLVEHRLDPAVRSALDVVREAVEKLNAATLKAAAEAKA